MCLNKGGWGDDHANRFTKKDELRRELRMLHIIKEDVVEGTLGERLINERIEDIKKALED